MLELSSGVAGMGVGAGAGPPPPPERGSSFAVMASHARALSPQASTHHLSLATPPANHQPAHVTTNDHAPQPQ